MLVFFNFNFWMLFFLNFGTDLAFFISFSILFISYTYGLFLLIGSGFCLTFLGLGAVALLNLFISSSNSPWIPAFFCLLLDFLFFFFNSFFAYSFALFYSAITFNFACSLFFLRLGSLLSSSCSIYLEIVIIKSS